MKILFIAELTSIHAIKWINLFKESGLNITIYQSLAPSYGVNDLLNCGILYLPNIHSKPTGKTQYINTLGYPSNIIFQKVLFHCGFKIAPNYFKEKHNSYLSYLINNYKPDIIHSLGLYVNGSNICLPLMETLKRNRKYNQIPWIYSTWGADLDYFAQLSDDNLAKVKQMLKRVDFQIAECQRDKELAIKFGFKGKFLGYFPGGGGLSLKTIDRYCKKGSVSKRRIIIVKGRDYIDGDPIGRAMTIMKALLLCKHKLNGYQVIVIQAGKNITHEASKLKVKGINIICLSGLPYTKLLELMGKTKIFIADTINDGLPNTLVESISLGAFPIHSNLFSLQDWIKNRENGLLVDSGDIKKYAYSINMALSNDNFIDRASKINKKIVFSRLCSDVVKKKMIQIYKDIINENIIH